MDLPPPEIQVSQQRLPPPAIILPNRDHMNYDNRGDDQVIGSSALRPIFFGNLVHECNANDIEDIFVRPLVDTGAIPVDRVDLKRGFCFVFLQDAKTQSDKDRTERYVRDLNGMDIAKVSKQLRAEFARGDGRIKRKEDNRRKLISPSETLFVVNFHEDTTKRDDLEMLFQPYGEIVRIDMKRNYAFVQFTCVDNATKAKEATNGGKLDRSVITVEYVAQRMGEVRERRPDRDRLDRSDYRRDDTRRDTDYRRERNLRYRDDDYRTSIDRRSPPRDRPDSYRSRGGRSRSRSPVYRYRSRSPSPKRDRGEYRNGGRGAGYDENRRSPERSDRAEYRDAGRGRSSDKDYRSSDARGYK